MISEINRKGIRDAIILIVISFASQIAVAALTAEQQAVIREKLPIKKTAPASPTIPPPPPPTELIIQTPPEVNN